jgi:ABC-type Na+ efflux pump permease subunit
VLDLFEVEFSFAIEPQSLVMMLLAALLAAATLAAVMMLVSIGAKNYREGQAMLMPAYMIASLSGVVVIASEAPFTLGQALIPAINVVALLKALLRGDVPLVPAAVAYAELLILAVASVTLASKIARKEGVFFDPEVSLKRLLGIGKEAK